MSDNFIEEIKEEVRNDQIQALWREYGNVIIGFIITIIIATIGYLLWHSHKEDQLVEQTLAYEKNIAFAADSTQKDQADFSKLQANGTKGYQLLSSFQGAALVSSLADVKAELEKITENSSYNAFYRQLAQLQIVMKKFDSTNGKELLKDLEILVGTKSIVQAAALELAAFAHMKLNNGAAAKATFVQVAQHPNATQSMVVRARAMVEMLG